MITGQTKLELTEDVSSQPTCRFLTRDVGETVGFSFDVSAAGVPGGSVDLGCVVSDIRLFEVSRGGVTA